MFIDRIRVRCRAGKGGNGIVAWRREKYIPKGGPAGGNGGKGGSIFITGDHNVYSLDWFSYKTVITAQNGTSGQSACKTGKCGEDLILKLPCGTIVKDVNTGEVLFDIQSHGQKHLLCQGGRGGKGNYVFRSSTNRAPNIATPGTAGDEKEIEFELKLIADVGLIGLPNAGKSTLINMLTDIKVKIAPYPFTTLHPNLGYIYSKENEKILIADIPGIIEGAHVNRGLGYEFLRHIERTKMLIYVLDAATFNPHGPMGDFTILQNELRNYNPDLLDKPSLIVLNKSDVAEAQAAIAPTVAALHPKTAFITSALTGAGCPALLQGIQGALSGALTTRIGFSVRRMQ